MDSRLRGNDKGKGLGLALEVLSILVARVKTDTNTNKLDYMSNYVIPKVPPRHSRVGRNLGNRLMALPKSMA